MTVKLLTFLGVGKNGHYDPYCYQFGEDVSEETPYIQRALMELLHKTAHPPEEMYVFLTPEAERQSWLGPGKLKEQLIALREKVYFSWIPVPILGATKTKEIWEDFKTVFDVLRPEDEVIFDITHSFRHQPMMALLILHFARITKNIMVRGIYYGNIYEVPAQVVDLTSFADLQDWIINVYAFTEMGRAEPFNEWVRNKKRMAARTKGQGQAIEPIQKMARSWVEFTTALQACRGPLVRDKAVSARRILEDFKDQAEALPDFQPINILLDRVNRELQPMEEDDVIQAGFAAIDWCKRHGLVQQTFTLLYELVITAVCEREGYDKQRVHDREDVARHLHYASKLKDKRPMDSSSESYNMELVNRLLQYPEMVKRFHDIANYRNDFNHAGWRSDAKEAKTIMNFLDNHYEEVCDAIRDYWQCSSVQA